LIGGAAAVAGAVVVAAVRATRDGAPQSDSTTLKPMVSF
jgi:hypothetical protein